MKFQGDPGPFKRVTAALYDLVGVRARANSAATASATAAAEAAIRQTALAELNLPAARWTTLFNSMGVTIGVDLQAVRAEGANRVAWIKTTFADPQIFPEGPVSLVLTEQRFDCQGKRTQVIRTVMALSESVVARAKDPGNRWTDVAKDSTVRGMLGRVCRTAP
jgi:hypothetical protein